MSIWDLTPKLSPNLDNHLVMHMMEFLINQTDIYNIDDLNQAKLELVSKTNLVDYEIDLFSQIYPDQQIPEKFQEKRNEIVDKYSMLVEENAVITDLFSNEEVLEKLQEFQGNTRHVVDYLIREHDFEREMVDKCFAYAKCLYELNKYQDASRYLYIHRNLIQQSNDRYLDNLWGRLACEILAQEWPEAIEELKRLQQYIDESTFQTSITLLQQRTWLIHWSLFIFFHGNDLIKGCDLMIEMFLHQKQYLNVIQTSCPWILRYLSVAAIINRKTRRNVMKDLVKVIEEESYTYRDPITSFIEDLCINFNFKGAQKKLRECETVLANDFFLCGCQEDFRENSRLMIFETFCRIHQCISISMLADQLNMGTEEAERWIVNLIRNAKLDAKIDSQLGHVVMGTQTTSPYEQLIERTKALSFRSQMLQLNVEKKKKAQDQPNWGTDGF